MMRTGWAAALVSGALLMTGCSSPKDSAADTARASTSSVPPVSPSASASTQGLTGNIVYGRFDGDTVTMFTARPDGAGVKPLLPGSGGEPRQWSPDGTMLTVTATNHGSIVGSVVRADGTHQLVFQLPPGAPAALACGFWSPDAKRLACEGFDDAHPDRAGIYTVSSSDGQHPVRVTKQPDVPCSYSPDGKRILFLRQTVGQEGSHTLMTANIDGTDPRTVIPQKVGLSCDWSPDGQTILSERENSLILIHQPSGKTTPVPIATGGRAGRGAFSPDGSHIIFSLKLANQEDIYIVRTDGSGLTQITDTPADEEFGDWGP